MGLDLSAFANGIAFPISADTTQLEQGLDRTDNLLERTESRFNSTTKSLAAFTAGIAALSVAAGYVRNLTDETDKLNQQSAITAYSLHTTIKAVTDLVVSVSDAEHDVKEMSKAVDLLARAGVDLEHQTRTVTAFKDLGEVLNEDTTLVESEVIPALNAFGLKITDIGNYSYIFAHVVRTTTLSLSDFSMTVSRLAPNLSKIGLGLEDVAAIFEIMASKGIQGRSAMMLFNETITAMSKKNEDLEKSTNALKDATRDYDSALKSLNDEQKDADRITLVYQLRMKNVGRDVSEARRLTEAYNIDMTVQAGRIADAQKIADEKKAEVGTAQTAVTTAENAPQKTFYEAFKEATGINLTPEMITSQKGVIDANKDMVTAISTAKEQYTTDTDKMNSWLEKLALKAGDLLQPLQSIATGLAALGPVITVAGALAAIASALGFGAAATGAAGAGAAGSPAPATAGTAGGGLSALLLPLAAGLATFAGMMKYVEFTKGLEKTDPARYKAIMEGIAATSGGGAELGLKSFDLGGVVPGSGPVPIIAHGGETITPPGRAMGDTHYWSLTVNASRDYPLPMVIDDAQRLARQRRVMGVPTR